MVSQRHESYTSDRFGSALLSHAFGQRLLCHHRNRTHGPVALPWLKVLLFAMTLPCGPQGSGRFSLLCSDCPRLPTKAVVTDKHFWSVICIPGKLECPFSFPWLCGQVIRLWWYELFPRGLQLHLQGHMIIKQTAQDFPGTPSNFMRRIQTSSCPKDKPCLHLPALFSWSVCVWSESFWVLRTCFADVVLPPTSTYNSASFLIPAGPAARSHPQCCDNTN